MNMSNGQAIVLAFILALVVWAFSELFNFIIEEIDKWIKNKIAQRKANKFINEANTHE